MAYDKSGLVKLARINRKNLTPAELKLWHALRQSNIGGKFRRQEPIGQYIVDFVSYEYKIIIECDGVQHGTGAARHYDKERTEYLESLGFRVIRFWNGDIMRKLDSCLELIYMVKSDMSVCSLRVDE